VPLTLLFVAARGRASWFPLAIARRGGQTRPQRRRHRVLTGGASRVSDAMALLAAGYGKRL